MTGSPTRPRAASTGPGTPTPMASIDRVRLAASSLTFRISALIAARGSAGALPRVRVLSSTTTSPSRVTTPAAVVVPPTSTPTIAAVIRGAGSKPVGPTLEVAEVAEPDAEARGRRARARRPETDHLGLALSPVTAVGERVIEPSRVRHELGDDGRQGPGLRDGSSEGPVGAGARLPQEVVGGPKARGDRAGTRP